MRILIRRLSSESACVSRQLWEFDADGYGRAVYSLNLAGRHYSLCAFTAPLSESERTDRVIATRWDATFALYDGLPTASDLERIKRNVSRQEQRRYSPKELVISRANKSVRLFEHVVDRLAQGLQPHAELVKRTGYLMRTTAVYGNGKFGIADRHVIADRAGFHEPFQAELLTVWLIRGFTLDLVEHIAKSRSSGSFAPFAWEVQTSPRHRQRDGAGHGAFPGQPLNALEQLDGRARNRSGARSQNETGLRGFDLQNAGDLPTGIKASSGMECRRRASNVSHRDGETRAGKCDGVGPPEMRFIWNFLGRG